MRYQKIKKEATDQDTEPLNDTFDEKYKSFSDFLDAYIDQGKYFSYCEGEKFEDYENGEDIEIPPYTRRHKIRMNRLFRERVGGAFIPFPEVDNHYEKIRSKIVVILKINEFLDFCKRCRRNR